jgi:hypothetical protein
MRSVFIHKFSGKELKNLFDRADADNSGSIESEELESEKYLFEIAVPRGMTSTWIVGSELHQPGLGGRPQDHPAI